LCWRISLPLKLRACVRKQKYIVKVITAEAPKHNYLVRVELGASLALTWREFWIFGLNQLPLLLILGSARRVKTLNRVKVALCGSINASEHVDPLFVKDARRVVVATMVQLRLIEPNIQLNVVELA